MVSRLGQVILNSKLLAERKSIEFYYFRPRKPQFDLPQIGINNNLQFILCDKGPEPEQVP